ncbi:hypothetical protein BGW42_006700 [Actinomortierella wolfii]|nr:hypothetical protein BGW42_006700 [Actinomortierella wolfii]
MFPSLTPLLVVASVAALALQASASPVPETSCRSSKINTVVVFGDSASDNGNVYRLSNKTWPLAFNYKGRFTNGPNWSDIVAKSAHVKMYNFAYGGATIDSAFIQGYSGAKSDIPVPGFFQQIEEHYLPLALSPKALDSTLFIVDFQGNDYFFKPDVTPAEVVDHIEKGVRRLISLGARNILIVGISNFGLIPYFASDPATVEAMSKLAEQEVHLTYRLTQKLQGEYGVPPRRHPFRQCHGANKPGTGVRVAMFDQMAFYEYLYQPHVLRRLGIKDVTGQCETPDYSAVCSNPGDYFYWDSFHSSAKVHLQFAKALLEFI